MRNAAAAPAATDDVDRGIEPGFVRPQRLAGREVEREHIAGTGLNVNDAVDDERLRLAGILRPNAGAFEPRAPHAFELRDVAAIDLGQRRVALVVPIAAVRRPADGWRRNERRVGRCASCEQRGG
jgi:hypothetical protein